MKFLLATTLTCVVLMVESTEIGKGLSQMPVLSLDGLLNNIMRIDRTVAGMKSDIDQKQDSVNSSAMLQLEQDVTGLKKQNLNLQSDVNRLNEKLKAKERRVVFEAQLKSQTYFGYKEALKFPQVTLNTGNAYNPRSGIFLVPADGTYFMWANVMYYTTGTFTLYLMREQVELARGYTGYNLNRVAATINHLVKLKKGDHVWFSVSTGRHIRGNNYSSFGGFLLFV